MFLKTMDLFGFKSFADKSRIEFTTGISALLGPNGCGKSNVVDAIKWVLGEQSTKTLRAERMEDVIFNGTEARKALNVAEVTLSLSNDEALLPIDVPEIEIKRRLYRSGESEYLINNTATKLREIRELFFDTGIGKSAYSIMEQGKIDQILSNKPEERRYIFEEAAGITKFKVRGAEAERKLEKTEENMRQAEGILKEVKRSYDTLKVQADKAREYRTLRDRVFEHEMHLQLLRLREFLENQEKKQDRLDALLAKRNEVRAAIDEVNRSLESSLDLVNTMESELIEKQKRLYRLELERSGCESQIKVHHERTEEVRRHIAARRERSAALERAVGSLDEQIAAKNGALEEFVRRLEEVERNIADFRKSIEGAQSRIIANEQAIRRHEKSVRDLENELLRLQEELRILYDDIVTQLDTRLQETGYSYQRRKASEEALYAALDAFAIHLEGRIGIVGDALSIASTGKDEKDRVLESCLGILREGLGKIRELGGLLDAFRDSVPAFIDDFLAPEGIITRKRQIDRDVQESRRKIVEHRSAAEELRTENAHLAGRIDEYRKTLEELRLNQVRMRTQKTSLEEAVALLLRQRADHEEQLAESRADIERSTARLESIAGQIAELEKRRLALEADAKTLEKELSTLERTIAQRNKDLVDKEKRLKGLSGEEEKLRSQIEALQVELASIRTEIRNLYDNFQERHSRDLHEFQDRLLEINTPAAEFRRLLADVREQLRVLGQVNLMAPEEFEEVRQRYDFLSAQINDLSKAREDLKAVTQQIRKESTELFLDTYEKVKRSFHVMFRRLFGGGRAELALTDAQKVLESGIEILAQPPGKKLESIDLLSGGEKSLTAVALLFATYMVKPSPFCVLDEIDAALDEENVGRFVALLKEFSRTTQFVIITHNKRTIASAETLLGVTMEESGVSKVISVRVGAKEEIGVQ